MVSVNIPAMSNDDLIARVAGGDIASRQDLAARLRKLRWMGNNDEAKLLVAKIGAQRHRRVPIRNPMDRQSVLY